MSDKPIRRSVYISKNTMDQIEKVAHNEGVKASEVMRGYIEKGLSIDGYKQDVDFIADIIREELKAVYHVGEIKDIVKTIVEAQTNRLAKMLMKSGKLSSAEFFLLIKVLIYMWDEKADYDFDQMLTEAVTLGVDYMQKKDFQINSFLEDTANLRNLATGLGGE